MLFVGVLVLLFIFLVWLHVLIYKEARRQRTTPRGARQH